MVFPLNFVVGAAVGAIATYVYKDEEAKNWVVDYTTKAREKVSSFVKPKEKEAQEEVEPVTGEVVTAEAVVVDAEEVTEKPKATRRTRAAKQEETSAE